MVLRKAVSENVWHGISYFNTLRSCACCSSFQIIRGHDSSLSFIADLPGLSPELVGG